MDLVLDLDPRLGRRAGIERAVRDAIRNGRLGTGTDMPSTRALARDLGVARTTVVAAYEQLVAEGFLTADQGSGTRVAAHDVAPEPPTSPNPLGPVPRHDLRPGEPGGDSFPRAAWLRAYRSVLRDADDSLFGYPDPRGHPELRAVLAEHLARTRSVRADPDGVVVVAGFAAALGHLGDLFRRRAERAGRCLARVAVEDPMLFFHRQILMTTGVDVVPTPVDDHGLVVDALPDDVDAVLVTPAHQHPCGVTMSPERRSALVRWADRADAYVVEDDYDGEFRYDRRPIGALQALAPDRVIHAGTASKTLAPALRIAWLTLPPALRAPFLHVLHIRAGVSAVDQLVLARFLASGRYDRQVRSMRQRYRRRRATIVEAVEHTAPWLRLEPNAAGLHLTGWFADAAISEADVLAAADRHEVGLLGLGPFHVEPGHRPGIVIGFSRPAEHEIDAAIEALAAALGEVSTGAY